MTVKVSSTNLLQKQGGCGDESMAFFPKILHKQVGYNAADLRTHSSSSLLLIWPALEGEISTSQAELQKADDMVN